MPWAFTLHVTACAGGGNLDRAYVTDGTSTYYTTSYGMFTAVIYDDSVVGYAVNVGKAGYVTRYTAVLRNQAGSTIQVCLDAAPGGGGGGGGGSGCFIVSATTGSAESAENMRLNMLRDRVLRTTEIGAALLDAINREYYSFSPPIAEELAADGELREQVLEVAVRPLLAWYGLVEVLALDGEARDAAERAVEAVLEACRASTHATAGTTAALLDAIRRGEPLPDDAPEPFRYLGSRLQEPVALPFAAWAIIAPLVLIWECAATGADVIESAATWLADAPLDKLPPPVPGDRLDDELAQLARGPFASLPLRREVGARLASVWPHLDEELIRHGFLAGDDTRATS